MFEIYCTCGKKFSLDITFLGKNIQCTNCGEITKVCMDDWHETKPSKDEKTKDGGKVFFLSRLVISGLLFLATTIDNPKGYYHPDDDGYFQILRWLVCPMSAYIATCLFGAKRQGWVWVFSVLAILFNPVFPVHIEHDAWKFIDVGAGLLMLSSIWTLRKNTRKNTA